MHMVEIAENAFDDDLMIYEINLNICIFKGEKWILTSIKLNENREQR